MAAAILPNMLRPFRPRWMLLLALLTVAAVPARAETGREAFQRGDYAAAARLWENEAKTGDTLAEYALGYLYEFGLGVTANDETAAKWYEKAVTDGDPDAAYALGRLIEGGRGVEQDYPRALAMYSLAAAGGQTDAVYALGKMYLRGRGTERDPREALRWFLLAAEADHAGAQYMLGAFYETGSAGETDLVKAHYWYARAAQHGQDVLTGYDPTYNAAVALDGLMRRMNAAQIERARAMLREAG